MASISLPVMEISYAASISRMQVGLVTLISVSLSPMTSKPTNSSPFSLRVGATARAIFLSVSLSGRGSPRPPAAKLPRVSPLAGIRAKQ
ncbi:Uncharacterised protein [Vibrio cholerae]|uniref:Uncharacterized protein n=1 Tax=Vibrio cholerae TaxID=666 RepID=A0A655RB20_VIBCL|nr:Uncharacterised protein [Vibrio cholerae]CSB20234.1 Uncharacterised protein [Vibrio cholerae]